ncbi:hypothetical protein LAUMK191_05293 [Mycobacterium attenuatum]|nr:DUF2330 domain-containing protein [Mycobacterium attenuatum]VBA59982.1 hypothetical protein LAUMK191_05293 [Mycobacterium attenuatum]
MARATLPRNICGMAVLRFCRLVFGVGLLLWVTMATMVLAAPGHACACGAAIAPGGAHATMNHEVALVHWDGTTETIVMQIAMDATTDNVALVVPTPAPATVAAADKATFVELDTVTAPQVQHKRRWILGIGMVGSAPREGAAAAHAPDVVSQVQLGPLEATTLAGGDLAGLQDWLAGNGYAIRPAVAAALDPYVRDGWAFVAIRLTSSAPIVGGLDPVRMTFPAPQLVYPMRLSVAATDPQHVVVYTLADHRQQRTDADRSRQFTQVQFAGTIAGEVRDPVLRELAANHGSYLTKTEIGVYQPSQISSDFTFANAANDNAYRQVVVVYDNVAIPILVILFVGFLAVVLAAAVILFVVFVRRGSGQRRRNSAM